MGRDSNEELVVVRRFDDAIAADIAKNFLIDHGIRVTVLGNSTDTTLLNRFTTVFDVRLAVRASDAEEAARVLDAMTPDEESDIERAPELEEEGEAPEHAYRANAKSKPKSLASGASERSRRAATGLAIIVPGGGHLYARHNITGLLFSALILGSFITAGATQTSAPAITAVLLIAFDAVFGPSAVTRQNEGRTLPAGRQALLALGAFAFCLGIGLVASDP